MLLPAAAVPPRHASQLMHWTTRILDPPMPPSAECGSGYLDQSRLPSVASQTCIRVAGARSVPRPSDVRGVRGAPHDPFVDVACSLGLCPLAHTAHQSSPQLSIPRPFSSRPPCRPPQTTTARRAPCAISPFPPWARGMQEQNTRQRSGTPWLHAGCIALKVSSQRSTAYIRWEHGPRDRPPTPLLPSPSFRCIVNTTIPTTNSRIILHLTHLARRRRPRPRRLV
ncbi:hypothetical protein CC85DRAFT_100539 [Cutaneotrichosporon oleaginosum]|uniref:Uncharacterized protein n=1 Tax=Cutaneotrichosporon oleaginosum TaxID=879819 RepID=A0A0J0XLM5_9TREE|nr:uncharacterized protein CC85DRAFT_100539 [Cutaneotrichosporon oleaginosum]KLT41992.1 hypothetical protein CC85DRAFT_100539 [Cutaneotrichosporon oleaginosum]TXT14349.1 hypothetical protein COLE_00542 [Cutaneotrichosporon oleaginosum]